MSHGQDHVSLNIAGGLFASFIKRFSCPLRGVGETALSIFRQAFSKLYPTGSVLKLRFLPQLPLGRFSRYSPKPCLPFLEKHPSGNSKAGEQCGDYGTSGGTHKFVSPNRFLEPVEVTWRAGGHRFLRQVPLDIPSQTVGGLISPRPVLLQALHDNPVQVPTHGTDQFGRLCLAALGGA